MNKKIELTEEQKRCVEWPLNNNLFIEANPGTGKTEILKYRTLFIHQQSEKTKKLILVLAYGRNIAAEIRTKLKAEKMRVYNHLKNVLPILTHRRACSLNECLNCLEDMKPLVLVCTIHSLANGINQLVIKEQFQEKRKTKILVATQTIETKHSVVSVQDRNEKFIWKSKGSIKSRKKKLFNYLLSQVEEKFLGKVKRKILWGIFSQSEPENVVLDKLSDPYIRYEINYSRFLVQVPSFLPEDKELLNKLEESCRHDREKNVWLDFDDIIANVNRFATLKSQKIWPEFDYILVDECQDLKNETFKSITEIFGNKLTNFTFVGDPKQNIMGFAGARENIFSLLEQNFPGQNNSTITTSFRLPQEIADFANDFIAKFMNDYRTSIKTNKSNNGHKPQIITVGQAGNYLLNQNEEEEIEKELESNFESKRSNLVKGRIRRKKLNQHLAAILPIINKLDDNFSKAIMYRQNWIGNLLQEWLNEKCVITNISAEIINDIIRKVRRQFKGLREGKIISDFLEEKQEVREQYNNGKSENAIWLALGEKKEHNAIGEFTKPQCEAMIEILRKRAKKQKSERHQLWLNNKADKLENEMNAQLYKEWIKISYINVSGFYSQLKAISLENSLNLEEGQSLNQKISSTEFPSLQSFLVSLKISENIIFPLVEIVKKIDGNSPPNSNLTINQINDFVAQLEEIKKHRGITLSTIHGMKGLEADYVFLIFCDKKVLPKKEKFTTEWEEREEKNLFFTAITRPKIGLYITTSCSEECSDFINPANLNSDLVEFKNY